MVSKPGQSGSAEASASTSTKKAGGEPAYDAETADAARGTPAPAPGDLAGKQTELERIQAQEKQLVAEIASLRARDADRTAFDAQIKANGEALDRERTDLQTFVTNELKAVDAKTQAAIAAIKNDVDGAIAAKKKDYGDATDRTKATAAMLATSTVDAAAAEAAYNGKKQGVAELKRVLGELKTVKKDIQAAEGRNEFMVAGYWLMEMADRLKHAELPDAADLTSAWDELGRKRKAVDDARREADAARLDEADRKKKYDEAERKRETSILEQLKAQTEAQKPETAV